MDNPSFEIAGSLPGEADGWTVVTVATLVTIAAFDSAVPQAAEDFEEEWLGNEGFLFAFAAATITVARFDSADDEVEDFDNEWLGNESFVTTIQAGVNGTAAVFDTAVPRAFEDFEQEWDDNQFFAFSFPTTSITPALFDLGDESVEDFENEWNGNEAFLSTLFAGPTMMALFDSADTTAENFEDEWPTLILEGV